MLKAVNQCWSPFCQVTNASRSLDLEQSGAHKSYFRKVPRVIFTQGSVDARSEKLMKTSGWSLNEEGSDWVVFWDSRFRLSFKSRFYESYENDRQIFKDRDSK